MTTRRMTSRQVALTAAFLALAAGGTAACDSTRDEDLDYSFTADSGSGTGYGTGYDPATEDGPYLPDDEAPAEEEEEEESSDEVFYCADEDGEIVEEDNCDDGSGTSQYFLWHSAGYDRGLRPGTGLDGGEAFPAGDRASRRAFELPATGPVGNGTVKTNVVGRGSTGASGLTAGTSGG